MGPLWPRGSRSAPPPSRAGWGALFQFPVRQGSEGSEAADRLPFTFPRRWGLTATWIRAASVAASPASVIAPPLRCLFDFPFHRLPVRSIAIREICPLIIDKVRFVLEHRPECFIVPARWGVCKLQGMPYEMVRCPRVLERLFFMALRKRVYLYDDEKIICVMRIGARESEFRRLGGVTYICFCRFISKTRLGQSDRDCLCIPWYPLTIFILLKRCICPFPSPLYGSWDWVFDPLVCENRTAIAILPIFYFDVVIA